MFIPRKILILILCVICPIKITLANNLDGIELAESVLDKLYRVSGQYIYEKPGIEISLENEKVAAYSPSKNLITIDEKALKICLTMGDEASNALAFLIGHELAHAFQKEIRQHGETTHFLAYDKHFHNSLIRTEKVADIQGVFVGYLANFGMQKAIPIVLEKLYSAYGLMGATLPNYPSYEERLQSAKEVVVLVEDLIDLFEANHYLLALEQYKLASVSLEHILEYYQGYEIQNNIGVTYLYSITSEFVDPNTDKYAFPIRLDETSHLAKIDISRVGELNYMQRSLRNKVLDASLDYFEKSIELNPNYLIAKINKACVLNLLQQHEKAQKFINSQAFNAAEKNTPEFKLVMGITAALSNNSFQAINIFDEISKSRQPIIAAQGKFNLNVLKGGELMPLSNDLIRIPNSFNKIIDGLTLGNTRDWHSILLDSKQEIEVRTKKNKTIKSFSYYAGFNSLFSIVLTNKMEENLVLFSNESNFNGFNTQNIFMAGNSIYLIFKKEKLIVKCNQDGEVLSIGRFK